MWTIKLPLSVLVSKNKWFVLNLNHYRNAYFRQLDKAKKEFKERVTPLVRHLPKLDQDGVKIQITYVFYAPKGVVPDLANVCCIVDKFFSDVLVEAGKLEDDNPKVLPHIRFSFGGVDRGNPRVEAIIEPFGSMPVPTIGGPTDHPSKESNMKIQIVQTEIEAAIRAHILNQIKVNDGMRIDMTLRATRGEEGFVADIDIVPDTSVTVSAASAATTTSAPLGITEKVTRGSKGPTAASTASTTEAPVSEPVAAEPQESLVEGDQPLKPSIFGGLNKTTETAEA